MNIYIADPKNPATDGKHNMIKFKIPRETAKVYIRSDPDPYTFTVFCNFDESENWDLAQIDSKSENVLKIPFKKGTEKSFYDKENEKESIWKKYFIPIIPFAKAIASAI